MQTIKPLHISELLVFLATTLALLQARADGTLFPPLHPENGPWAIDYYDALWGTTNDPAMFIGYNQMAGGLPFRVGEPGLALGFEGNYQFANGNNKMEFYLQYIDGLGGQYLRPLFFSFNRQTRRLDNAFIGGAPIINFGDANDNSINAQISRNSLTLFGPDTSQGTVINVKTTAGSGEPGVLSLGFDGADGVLTILPATRNVAYFQIGGANGIHYYRTPLGGSPAGSIAVGGLEDNSAIGVFGSENASDNVKALVARGKDTMRENVFEVQTQDQSVVHGVDKNGVVYMSGAPAPEGIPAYGGVYLYVDQLDNKLKYRDASGVVHTLVTTP